MIVDLRDVDRSERPVPCCREKSNLRCEQVAPSSFVEHCSCGKRHYVFEADPVQLGVAGRSI